MNLNELVTKWESFGFLGGLDRAQKTKMSLKYETLTKHLINLQEQPNYKYEYGEIELLIFALLFKMCVDKREDGSHIFYENVDPLILLNEFKTWWHREVNLLNMANLNLNTQENIDFEAELLLYYINNFKNKFRYNDYN